ncbi:MAG: mechanosensitive ion channel family protein [Candidatus Gastranaerophilaceae bacterium]
MGKFFTHYDSISEITQLIVSSIWFSLIVRILFLLLFLKIADIVIAKIKMHVLKKAVTVEAEKQLLTIFELIRNIVYFLLTIMFVLAFLGKIGIDVRPFLATAGVAGLAIGFASKRFIEDLIQGLIIISSGQVRIGDYVQIAGLEGTVEKIDMKMVTLRSSNGNVHFIRNGLIEIITNFTRDYSVALMDLGVSYDENPDRVMDVLKDIFYNQLMKNPEMEKRIISDIDVQGLTKFDDSAIIIRTVIRTRTKEQWAVQREFNKLILQKFKEENIEIPYPYRTIIMKQQ